jgi:hypothetical protein
VKCFDKFEFLPSQEEEQVGIDSDISQHIAQFKDKGTTYCTILCTMSMQKRLQFELVRYVRSCERAIITDKSTVMQEQGLLFSSTQIYHNMQLLTVDTFLTPLSYAGKFADMLNM